MPKKSENFYICKGINESAKIIFQHNKDKGFWDKERNVGELLMLVTSELGEAVEARRKGNFANWKKLESNNTLDWQNNFKENIKDTFEDEIADAVIRLLDLSAGLGIDLEKHINEKVKYNENRPKLHGKLY
jgi:NTP pyrophosphatase (non-canonical NTP hydrolase)